MKIVNSRVKVPSTLLVKCRDGNKEKVTRKMWRDT